MPAMLITGPAATGKSSLAYALLARLRDAGRSVAYCKPFSPTPDADADHLFAAEVLAGALGVTVGPAPRPLDRAYVEVDPQGRIVVDTSILYREEKGQPTQFNNPGSYIQV